MKRVLITGAGGFIGSHLTEKCVERGYAVKAFVHYNSKNNWGWLENSPSKKAIEVLTGDIRDYDSVFAAMQGVDTVLHLAALIGIPYSYVSPLAYIHTNIEGTYNVLQAARMLQTENVIITSTSETYGSARYVPIDEAHPSQGQSPYAATKIAADQLALSYFRSFGMPVKIVRPFNTFGPRQSARAFIPNVIIQILNGQRRLKVGNLFPTRDLTFVQDTVAGFLAIADCREAVGTVTNIGMGVEISMHRLASTIADLMGVQMQFFSDEKRLRPEKSEVDRLLCNNEKILRITNWKPHWDLHSGLENTITWFREKRDLYKPDIYNV